MGYGPVNFELTFPILRGARPGNPATRRRRERQGAVACLA